jgi:putative transposase
MELFHVLNRGVDKRTIVTDNKDRLRFMQGLFMYNDIQILNRNLRRQPQTRRVTTERELLVHIHAFCLMDNHYHLLLSPVNDDLKNLSAFMRKLNMGYSKYFNEKYDRVGALWQGKYKSIHIERDAHFQYIPYYIHLNPLDKKFPEWRGGSVKNVSGAIDFLMKYRWSSFLDYYGSKNYPSIINTELLTSLLRNNTNQLAEIRNIIQDRSIATFAEMIE